MKPAVVVVGVIAATAVAAQADPAKEPVVFDVDPGSLSPCEPVPGSTAEAVLSRFFVADGCGVEGRTDFDADGYTDCWTAFYVGGSGFGGWYVSVDPSCLGNWQTIDDASSFSEALAAIPIPADATTAHIAAWVALLWGRTSVRTTGDGAMDWLIDEARGHGDGPPFRFTPRWAKGVPTATTVGQTVVLQGAAADELVTALPAEGNAPTGRAFARTWGQRPLKPAARCKAYRVYRSDHGVAVRTKREWAWVYLWTGEDKLRHAGIGKVACVDDLVLVEAKHDGGWQLLVISPAAGRVAAITSDATWRVAHGGVRVGGERISTAELRRTLGLPTR